jgi:hypothetical protein
MAFNSSSPDKVYRPLFIEGAANATETLTGARVLVAGDGHFLKLDPGGASRNVDLPAEELSAGMFYFICNAADAAENLVVRDDAASTIVTLNQNEAAWVACTGSAWVHYGVITIALT